MDYVERSLRVPTEIWGTDLLDAIDRTLRGTGYTAHSADTDIVPHGPGKGVPLSRELRVYRSALSLRPWFREKDPVMEMSVDQWDTYEDAVPVQIGDGQEYDNLLADIEERLEDELADYDPLA